MISPTEFLPDEVKRKIYDVVIDVLANVATNTLGDKVGESIRKLSANAEFNGAFNQALEKAASRFAKEYSIIDEEIVTMIGQQGEFWKSKSVIAALKEMIRRPSSVYQADQDELAYSFEDVLPAEIDRERVQRAVRFILSCLADQLWDVPVLLPVYQSLFQRITAQHAAEMVRQMRGMREDTRRMILALVEAIRERQNLLGVQEARALLLASTFRVCHNLPNPPREFVGRKEEFADAISLLRPYPESRYHLITIDGVGGVGKTALALEIAHHFVREYDHLDQSHRFSGIIWKSAKRVILTPSGIVPREQPLRNLADIYAEIAHALQRPDIKSARKEEQDSLVRQALAGNRVLLIVDNLETVDDPRIVEFLLELPDPSKAIITTRHRLEGARAIRLKGMNTEDALKLIKQETQSKEVALTEAECRALGEETSGVPLAIVWTIGQIGYGRSVGDAVLHLKSAGGDYAKFCFSESIELLHTRGKKDAVRLLMGLSLFADSATRDALGYVCGLQDSKDARDEGLADLQKLSLTNYDKVRFSLLPLTKEYAIVELSKDLEFRKRATDRWFDWHVELTKQASGGKVDLDARVLESLKTEYANILWAIESSMGPERFDKYVELVRGMEFFWFGTGRWNEYEKYLDRGRLLAPKIIDRIHFAARFAWLSVMREDFEKAEELLASANDLLRELPDSPEKTYEKMRVEDFTGQMYMEMGDLDEGEVHLRESLRLARGKSDRRGIFACLKYLGEIYCKRNDAKTAKELLKEAEPLASGTREDQWIRGLAHTYHLRGLISNVEEKWDEAVVHFQTCIDYLKIWPDERLLTRGRYGLAFAKHNLGKTSEARTLLVENKETFRKLGMHRKVEETNQLLSQWQ